MSEGEEDSNDERKMLKSAASVARSSLSRRSKSTPKSYHQQSSEDEDADAEASADENTYAGATVNGAAGDSVAGAATTSEQMEVDGADVTTGDGQPTPQGKIANGKNAKSSKNRGIKHEIVDAESDVSDFLPMF